MKLNILGYLKKASVWLWLTLIAVGVVGGAIVFPRAVVAVWNDPFGSKAAQQAEEDRRRAEAESRQAEQERRRADERYRELAKMVSEGRAGLLEKYPSGYVVLYTDGRRVHEDTSNSGTTVLLEQHTAKIHSITDEYVSLDLPLISRGGQRFIFTNTKFPRKIGAKHNFLKIGNTSLTAEVIAVYGGEIAVVIGARED